MKPWEEQGCGICRPSWIGPGERPDFLAGDRSGYLLYRCKACGAYWEDAIRYAHEISEAEAREAYPQAF